jgi:hypothetical protein
VRTIDVAQRAASVSAALGILTGVLFLFAPIQGYCTSTITGGGPPLGATPDPTTVGVTTCGMEALWQQQEIFPMPFFAVLVWSLAPLLAYYGVRLRLEGDRNTGTAVVIGGVLLECTVLISFGAAPFFVPFVLIPLGITMTVALKRSPMG